MLKVARSFSVDVENGYRVDVQESFSPANRISYSYWVHFSDYVQRPYQVNRYYIDAEYFDDRLRWALYQESSSVTGKVAHVGGYDVLVEAHNEAMYRIRNDSIEQYQYDADVRSSNARKFIDDDKANQEYDDLFATVTSEFQTSWTQTNV